MAKKKVPNGRTDNFKDTYLPLGNIYCFFVKSMIGLTAVNALMAAFIRLPESAYSP